MVSLVVVILLAVFSSALLTLKGKKMNKRFVLGLACAGLIFSVALMAVASQAPPDGDGLTISCDKYLKGVNFDLTTEATQFAAAPMEDIAALAMAVMPDKAICMGGTPLCAGENQRAYLRIGLQNYRMYT